MLFSYHHFGCDIIVYQTMAFKHIVKKLLKLKHVFVNNNILVDKKTLHCTLSCSSSYNMKFRIAQLFFKYFIIININSSVGLLEKIVNNYAVCHVCFYCNDSPLPNYWIVRCDKSRVHCQYEVSILYPWGKQCNVW